MSIYQTYLRSSELMKMVNLPGGHIAKVFVWKTFLGVFYTKKSKLLIILAKI